MPRTALLPFWINPQQSGKTDNGNGMMLSGTLLWALRCHIFHILTLVRPQQRLKFVSFTAILIKKRDDYV